MYENKCSFLVVLFLVKIFKNLTFLRKYLSAYEMQKEAKAVRQYGLMQQHFISNTIFAQGVIGKKRTRSRDLHMVLTGGWMNGRTCILIWSCFVTTTYFLLGISSSPSYHEIEG
jgi:hypothetical protein